MPAQQPVPFGRYRLLNLLGEGGMAKVYRAVLSGPMGFEKEVALKRIDSRVTTDERIVRALINEARLGGQLRHKNIVEIYEFNHVDGNYYMAMEYVDGWTLDSLLRRCRQRREWVPATVVVEVLQHVCRGLDFAHNLVSKEGQALNLVHRDLKPGNIMISRLGDVKIMDFGIAKADTNLYKTTAADVTKGTPIYMSPEQVTGASLDSRSDIFSLGSIVHELVTLQVPFQGENLLAIMHGVLSADIAAARERVRGRVPQLEPILVKCMARNRDERFASVSELDKALREVKRQVAAGPSLQEWLEDVGNDLPQATRTGEFGPDGAPDPVLPPAGTESLASVSVQAIPGGLADSSGAGGAAGALSAQTIEKTADSFSDTLAVDGPDPGALGAASAIGAQTRAFFDTDGKGPPSGATRSQKAVPGGPVSQSRTQRLRAERLGSDSPGERTQAARRKKKKDAATPAMVALIAGLGTLAIGLAAWVVFGGPSGKTGGAVRAGAPTVTAPPADSPGTKPPADPGASSLALSAEPGAAGDAAAATRPAAAASSPGARSGSTEGPGTTTTPSAAKTGSKTADPARSGGKDASAAAAGRKAGEKTPAPASEKTPAPAPAPATGTASAAASAPAPEPEGNAAWDFNSVPWSTLYIDGKQLGSTPKIGVLLSAGRHTAVFDCSACDPPDKHSIEFTVTAGVKEKRIHRFESGKK
jgi:serine/threonine-protein kinase